MKSIKSFVAVLIAVAAVLGLGFAYATMPKTIQDEVVVEITFLDNGKVHVRTVPKDGVRRMARVLKLANDQLEAKVVEGEDFFIPRPSPLLVPTFVEPLPALPRPVLIETPTKAKAKGRKKSKLALPPVDFGNK